MSTRPVTVVGEPTEDMFVEFFRRMIERRMERPAPNEQVRDARAAEKGETE